MDLKIVFSRAILLITVLLNVKPLWAGPFITNPVSINTHYYRNYGRTIYLVNQSHSRMRVKTKVCAEPIQKTTIAHSFYDLSPYMRVSAKYVTIEAERSKPISLFISMPKDTLITGRYRGLICFTLKLLNARIHHPVEYKLPVTMTIMKQN